MQVNFKSRADGNLLTELLAAQEHGCEARTPSEVESLYYDNSNQIMLFILLLRKTAEISSKNILKLISNTLPNHQEILKASK